MITDGVLIVGPTGTGGMAQFIDKQREHLRDHVPVRVHERYSTPPGSGLARILRGLFRTLRVLALFPFQDPPEVVHVHTAIRFSFYRSAFFVLFAKYVWGSKVILHVHGSTFDEFLETDSVLVSLLQRAVFGAVDDVIVLSDSWREVVSKHVTEADIHVVPNAITLDAYDPQFTADPVRLVFVSNLVPRKGVSELLDALDELERTVERPFRVDIAGDGPLAAEVQAFVADRDYVTYHGYVSEERKRELLAKGSVFVLPTYAEGLPIAMLEGMASGNAIVSTAVGAIPEVIDEDNGLLVEPGDEEALVSALATLIRDPERTEAMARRNREACASDYTWERLTRNLLDVYESDPQPASAQ
ncbi:glycosyltransferase family 4 protein [Halorientalis halophila]|uniref:glycosyltransferase family 4 protein n=1 Tax=Halorientalis halophila TaxID=3108499 RepID=UPI003009ADDE